MKAVVLVGGFGTRLRPLTTTTPKQMLPVAHRPMIERVVAGLARHGVTDAVLSLGYRPDVFRDAYPEGRCAGVALTYAVEDEPLDTAGAVRFAATSCGLDERFLVVNGDVMTDLDVAALWRFHDEHDAEATIHLVPVDDPSRYGVVPIDDSGRVEAFIEKPPAASAPSRWINAGTYVLEPSVLIRIPPDRKVSIERETFPAMVAARTLYAMQSDVYWVDAGTPETYLQVQMDEIDGRRGPCEQPIARGAEVDPAAVVVHSVVEAGAVVGAGAEVRDSVILARARIEQGARVFNSIVAAGAVIGRGAVVRELSVVGEREVVAPGAQLVGERVPQES